jgi:hypothetical protein
MLQDEGHKRYSARGLSRVRLRVEAETTNSVASALRDPTGSIVTSPSCCAKCIEAFEIWLNFFRGGGRGEISRCQEKVIIDLTEATSADLPGDGEWPESSYRLGHRAKTV